MANPTTRLINNFSDRELKVDTARGELGNSNVGTVRCPIGPRNILRNLARRTTGERHTPQSSRRSEWRFLALIYAYREFAIRRNAEQLCFLQAERAGVGTVKAR